MRNQLYNLSKRVRLATLGAICASVLVAGQAAAGIVCFTSNVNPETFCDTAFHVRHSLSCFNPGPAYERVALFFNGECTVGAANTTTWLDVDLLVDNVLTAPSSSDNAFCTSTGVNNTSGHWSSNSTQGVATIAPGFHTVVARERLTSPGCFRLDDTSLMVLN